MAIYITTPLKVKSAVELKLVFVDDKGVKWSEAIVGKVKWIHKKFVAAAGIELEDLAETKQPKLFALFSQREKKY